MGAIWKRSCDPMYDTNTKNESKWLRATISAEVDLQGR